LVVLATEHGARRLVGLFATLTLLPLAFTRLQTIRYLVPALPFLLVCAARLVDRAASMASVRPQLVPIIIAAGSVALGDGLFRAAAQANLYRTEDNRVAATHWLRAHVRTDDRVILEDHPCYGPILSNEWGEGEEPGARPVAHDRLSSASGDLNAILRRTQGARFIVLDDWHMRVADLPEARVRTSGLSAYHRLVKERGAPPGYRLVARFAAAPHLWGWTADERESEILHVAFDHIPLTVYERVGASH
jgi:hypothetical protein